MSPVFLNIIMFLLVTAAYLRVRPAPTLSVPNSPATALSYGATYVLALVATQFAAMAGFTSSLAAVFVVVLVAWSLLFGAALAAAEFVPSLSRSFADVFGYFFVAGRANSFLVDTLVRPMDSNAALDNASIDTAAADVYAADLVRRIYGNESLLINEITVASFAHYWDMMRPLRKQEFKDEAAAPTLAQREKLFDIVVARETAGKAAWLVYVGMLVVALVSVKTAGYFASTNSGSTNGSTNSSTNSASTNNSTTASTQ